MASGVLSRRGYVGLHVETSSSSGGGLRIRSVAPGSSAKGAGLHAGDVLTHLDHNAVTDVFELRRLLRALRAGDPLVVDAVRDGQPISFAAEVMPFPLEQYAGARVELGQVDVGSHWLRSVAVVPDAGSLEGRVWGKLPPGRFPVVYFLPGAHWASEEYPLSPEHPVPALLGALARAGYASVRVERSGVGDSQGPPPDRADFDTELGGYRAGLRFILERDWAAPGCIFAFGHSLGAMIAPLLAHGEPVGQSAQRAAPANVPGALAGIACYAASALRISEGLVGAARRHAELSAHVEPALLERIERVAELINLVCEGQTPSVLFSRRPDLAAIAPSHFTRDQAYGRIASFYHQLERADIETAWRHLGLPALLMHGGRDWISTAEDSTTIAALVGPTARVVKLPGVDHHMSTEPEGARPRLAPSVAEALLSWLDERIHSANGSTTISQRP